MHHRRSAAGLAQLLPPALPLVPHGRREGVGLPQPKQQLQANDLRQRRGQVHHRRLRASSGWRSPTRTKKRCSTTSPCLIPNQPGPTTAATPHANCTFTPGPSSCPFLLPQTEDEEEETEDDEEEEDEEEEGEDEGEDDEVPHPQQTTLSPHPAPLSLALWFYLFPARAPAKSPFLC